MSSVCDVCNKQFIKKHHLQKACSTECVKEKAKRYRQSDEFKKKLKEYWKSDSYKKSQKKYQQQRRLEREAYIKKEREKENIIKFEVVSLIKKDPNRGMRFIKCNNDPINRGRLGHSKTFLNDVQKPKTYYW